MKTKQSLCARLHNYKHVTIMSSTAISAQSHTKDNTLNDSTAIGRQKTMLLFLLVSYVTLWGRFVAWLIESIKPVKKDNA